MNVFVSAAVMAFGSIMEGTDDKIAPTLGVAMGVLLRLMCTDVSLMVRDTAAWSIGVACSTHANRIATPEVTLVGGTFFLFFFFFVH